MLNAFEGLTIIVGGEVGGHWLVQFERRHRFDKRLAEQRDQPLFLAIDHGRVKHQLAAGPLVIADQCPVVQAKAGIRQLQIIQRLARQVFQMPTEIVAQVADQTAGEWQVETCW
ncbi:hypothetical protein D3C72_1708540 [compost metagenome]